MKDFLKPFVQKPLVRAGLDFNKVGHFQNLIDLSVAHTCVFTKFHRMYHKTDHLS